MKSPLRDKLASILTIVAVLGGRRISTAAGVEQFRQPLLKELWVAIQGTYALELDHESAPTEASPNLEDLTINDVLAAGTTLRALAASRGVRDELDAAMDAIYSAAFALERSHRFANKAAA
ncbi:MAG TPA: hypothetical protein VNF68_10425 [Candidatus Baltobacteraceae bacterium]|nr:hypothetical protein [Candidatus Baltobacteraceae bacterium]